MSATLTRPSIARSGLVISIGAVIAAILLGVALIALIGVSIPDALAAFVDGTIGSAYSIGASVNRSVVFALVGIGFIFANRANLTNVGGEGQIAMGGIAATAVALYGHVAGLPFGLSFILPMLAATIAGALWGGLAGFLKARAGTNEVIATLLLSFIAIWCVYWSVQSSDLLRQPMTNSATLPESLPIPDSTQLPLISGDPSLPLNIGLPLTLLLAVVIAIALTRGTIGMRLRAIGLNPIAARRAGIATDAYMVTAMLVAGAFGGLAGAIMLQGDQTVLKDGFSSGYGFDGLVVGLLARGSVTGVIAAALLFGFLRSGGISMEIEASVPSAVVQIIQGIIVVSLAGAVFWIERQRTNR
ncbi:MAG TPA: ABC transporter permease [Rhodopila sp.]|jgi:simple sugar transport system permease protein|nr:ABC transporter permease [Rhodopila sp.]